MTEPGIQSLVHRAEGTYYTISEVANLVGRSRDTIKRWWESGKVSAPSHQMPLGEGDAFVWLYTPDQVSEYQDYAKSVRPGRPKMGTA